MTQNKLLALLIAFISTISLISFSLSPFFDIQTYQYQGHAIISEDELNNVIAEYNNANILYLDHRDLARDLRGISYIKDVKITRDYPDTVIINITEREPLAKINNNGKYLAFTASGFIVESGALNTRVKVPEIMGLGYSFDNNRISFSPVLSDIVQALHELNIDNRSRLSSVIYEGNSLTAYYSQVPIYLGEPIEVKEKFNILQSIINKIIQEELQVEYIDLNLYKRPVIKLK
ncbi:MAG: cell division protein FtsQ/DivIB [Halanaerobiales bacterium]